MKYGPVFVLVFLLRIGSIVKKKQDHLHMLIVPLHKG